MISGASAFDGLRPALWRGIKGEAWVATLKEQLFACVEHSIHRGDASFLCRCTTSHGGHLHVVADGCLGVKGSLLNEEYRIRAHCQLSLYCQPVLGELGHVAVFDAPPAEQVEV